MAQLLHARHSVNVHLSITKRHIRLARHTKGAEELIQAIEPVLDELIAKKDDDELALEEIDFKRDLVTYEATELDNKIRDLSDACKKYDRDNPGLGVTSLILSNGITPIIFSPNVDKPTSVRRIIFAIQSLGENHPISTHIEPLEIASAKLQTALDALEASINAEYHAYGSLTLAKNNLTQQYEKNIHAASLKFGKSKANSLFPPIFSPTKKSEKKKKESNQAK